MNDRLSGIDALLKSTSTDTSVSTNQYIDPATGELLSNTPQKSLIATKPGEITAAELLEVVFGPEG